MAADPFGLVPGCGRSLVRPEPERSLSSAPPLRRGDGIFGAAARRPGREVTTTVEDPPAERNRAPGGRGRERWAEPRSSVTQATAAARCSTNASRGTATCPPVL